MKEKELSRATGRRKVGYVITSASEKRKT